MLGKILDVMRTWPILLVAVVMLAASMLTSGVSLAVTLYGLGKIAAGGYLGYWIDRLLFPYARPHEQDEADRIFGCLRRAIIVAACVIAAALVP